MKRIVLTLLCINFSVLIFGQATENNKLIELAKAYKNFMLRNEPTKEFIDNLQANMPANLSAAANFIVQTISIKPQLLNKEYLTLPEKSTLKSIYIIRLINYNIRKENPIDNNKLIDSVKTLDIPSNELVDAYYSILFVAVGNKLQPFDLSSINFSMSDYNLATDTEKGIFFLECMDFCGTTIWGYMNIVKPANTKTAYQYIKRFPKFDGLEYYKFTDLNFPDFEMLIVEEDGIQSYKSYYIDKYYDLLLSHLACLSKKRAKEKDIDDLLLGSIFKDRIFYKYSKKKEILESIFQERKQ